MRILLINQFFWPDVAPTGQYLCDLARYLSAEGNEVTVICSGGLYGKERYDESNPPAAKIIRISGPRYKRTAAARLLSYLMFYTGAFWHGLTIRKQDVVVTLTTPPLLSTIGTLIKTFRGARHFIWEMDVFPDALVALGALNERAIVTRVLACIQTATRRRSDGVIALGPCMRDRLIASGTPARLIHVADNWADGASISPAPRRAAGTLNVFYSGNLGMAHEVETIAATIRHFRNDDRFLFTFAGGGVGRDHLEKLCAADKPKNVRFLPYAVKDALNEHFAQADIGLVTELPACIGTVVPSKVYGLLAAGLPILFIGPRKSTPSQIIERFNCGWQIDPGNVAAVTDLLESIYLKRDQVRSKGELGRFAFEQHFDLNHGVARVATALGLHGPAGGILPNTPAPEAVL